MLSQLLPPAMKPLGYFLHGREEFPQMATIKRSLGKSAMSAPLESIVVTFHEGEISENAEQQRQFIFLVTENRPVLQPFIDEDATGPLTDDELEAAVDRLGETVTREQRVCVQGEVKQRAKAAGDPETLDPANVEFFTAGTWDDLDAFAKRLFLAQAITSQALFACASTRKP